MSLPGFGGWFAGEKPIDLGVKDGHLKPCPDRPNCVSSQASGASHVAPLVIEGEPAAAWRRLRAILEAMPRVHVVEQTATYLRAEAESRIFGFVDDMEFQLDAAANVVHVRSAARLGYSDLGVNRRRVEEIRAKFGATRAGS